MAISRNPRISELLRTINNYLEDDKRVSNLAEFSLLEKNISGEDLIGILDELKIEHKNRLQEKIYRIEELEKECETLRTNYDDLNYKYRESETYIEKYKPLIETIVSILEKTAKKEIQRIAEERKG